MAGDISPAQRWQLVRGADIPRNLRHLLLILAHYQGANATCWCRRESLAEELDVCEAVVSQNMKELERLNIVSRVWTSRNGRPTREYSIQFENLQRTQRSVRESSQCSVRESSGCTAPSVRESSQSVLGIPQGQCEDSLSPEQPENNHRTTRGGAALPSPTKSTFRKPTAQQVREYATERSCPTFDAERFVDHYESNGWRVGRSPMKDWKATVRNWLRSGGTQHNGKASIHADAQQEWSTLKRVIRSIDRSSPYKDSLQRQLKPQVFHAAESVGFRDLFSMDQFNETKLFTAFRTALAGGPKR